MKKTITFLLILGTLTSILVVTYSQQPKYYDGNGNLLTLPKVVSIDSSYIKSLPKRVTLTNLTKSDLRVFKNLMLQRVQESDKPYDDTTKATFDKIILDLNTKNDTITTFKIQNLPTYYFQQYAQNATESYKRFVDSRKEVRQFLRIAANVQKIDTAFYLLSTFSGQLDKTILKKDIKNRP